MLTTTQLLERALCVQGMIDDCNNVLRNLNQDVANYHNPSPAYDKHRLMFSYAWINKKIAKYTSIKVRLNQSLVNIITSIQPQMMAA